MSSMDRKSRLSAKREKGVHTAYLKSIANDLGIKYDNKYGFHFISREFNGMKVTVSVDMPLYEQNPDMVRTSVSKMLEKDDKGHGGWIYKEDETDLRSLPQED